MLSRFFVFIRAINVGGRRMTNDELLDPFIENGFVDVAAYQAAGNITLRCDNPNMVRREQLEPLLAGAYGFDPLVFVRTVDEMRSIVSARPFTSDQLAMTDGRVQVSFLGDAPDGTTIADAVTLVPPEDQVAFVGKEWFWLPRRGVSDSRLPVAALENIVGSMTIRTLGTVERMLQKFDG